MPPISSVGILHVHGTSRYQRKVNLTFFVLSHSCIRRDPSAPGIAEPPLFHFDGRGQR